MIIACPACNTRYDVPDSAIPPQGRKLKCATCGHGWHVDGAAGAAAAQAEPAAEPQPAPPPPPAPLITPDPPAPVMPPPIPAAPPVPPPPVAAAEPEASDGGPSPFDYQPPFEAPPRKSRWLLWLVLVVIVAALVGGFVAMRTNAGGLAGKVGLAEGGSPLVISFTTRPERRPMDSGNELLAVAGKVTNPTERPVRVPDIRAELRDAQGRAVYNWTIGAPVTRLAPGASAEFNAAEVDVPPAARTIHLKPGPMPQV